MLRRSRSGLLRSAPVLLLCALLCLASSASAEVVAVAAGIAPAVKEAMEAHVKGGGEPLEVVTGSCGVLAKQIAGGAPYQMILLSEPKWPQWLEEKGLLKESAAFAIGKLAFWWGKADAMIDLNSIPSPLAVPDPKTTAYGVLGKHYLEKRGLWEEMNRKGAILIVANAPAAVVAVKSGSAKAACVPVGTEIKAGGTSAVVPEETTPMIGGLLTSAGPASRTFWDFCLSSEAAPIWRKWGYDVR